ncbi:immunoglobulin superfamily member 5 isoform X2 [Ambystoma mexicanum]|uniref:immunoglobulin superfamily member 5 isoform X2 n=1 Tax=Ambystoma mexicanum TaxID=8296 RepID=UPI0037E84CFE
MDNITRFAAVIYVAVSLLSVNGTVRITNDSLIAVVHERTYIVCQASGWLPAPQMTWLINDSPVDPSNYITTNTAVSGGLEDAVSILNMTFGQNETVSCLASIAALPGPQSSTVFLTVRDKPAESSNMDYTTKVIIIAVTVSVGGLLLLIILIVVIVLCCRRRKKESSYQSQLKKVSTQRTTNLNTISKSDAAEANLGYNFEEPNNRRPLPEIPYESSSISDSFGQENNMDDIPAPVSIPYNGHHQNPTVPWKVRHLTHV